MATVKIDIAEMARQTWIAGIATCRQQEKVKS
jgi:hypothetical protein